jgi:hypothetical protein
LIVFVKNFISVTVSNLYDRNHAYANGGGLRSFAHPGGSAFFHNGLS